MPTAPQVQSPCVQVCKIDLHRNLCSGCGRTLEEIAAWPTMSDEQRARVLARLASRARSSC